MHGTGNTTTIELPQQLTSRPHLVERITIRIALALLIWSTRPQTDHVAERLENQQHLEREQRENTWVVRALRERPLL